MIDLHTRRADMALRAKPSSAQDRLRVGHAVRLFVLGRHRFPRGEMMEVDPFFRRSMAALATDAIVSEMRRIFLGGQTQVGTDVAFQTTFIFMRFGWILQIFLNAQGALIEKDLVGPGVRIASDPGGILAAQRTACEIRMVAGRRRTRTSADKLIRGNRFRRSEMRRRRRVLLAAKDGYAEDETCQEPEAPFHQLTLMTVSFRSVDGDVTGWMNHRPALGGLSSEIEPGRCQIDSRRN